MAKKKTDLVQTEQPPIDIQDDEFRGIGGSYIRDPLTGKRTRVVEAGESLRDNDGTDRVSQKTVTTETEKADEIE